MTLSVDLFWSFRSPYSYLATGRLVALARDYTVDIQVRPVYPLAVRVKDYFKTIDRDWVHYLRLDVVRTAEMRGIPFRWPRPDPIVMDFSTGDVPEDQPYIHRLMRLGVLAAERGHGLRFIDEVSRLLYSGVVENWHEGDHLAGAAARAGLDLAEMEATVAADPERLDALIVANEKDQRAAHHWGVPLMVFQGEAFFGQDRIDQLIWRLTQHGLAPRPGGSSSA